MKDEFTLTIAEREHPLWKQRLRPHLQNRIDELKARLCGLSLKKKETQQIRGRIAELEGLQRLATDAPSISVKGLT